MKRIVALVLLAGLACSKPETTQTQTVQKPEPPKMSYEDEIRKWHSDREARLRGDDGWLTLVGLYWLDDGENRVGSVKGSKVKLPENAPASAGTLMVRGAEATFRPDPQAAATIGGKPLSEPVVLKKDVDDDGPTTVEIGSLRWHVIKRGDRLAVRVKDRESEARKKFTGIEKFPIDKKWRVVARLEPYDPPKTIPIVNIVGQTSQEKTPGALVFSIDGVTHRLDPILEEGDEPYFVIFKDATAGKETYAAGRYLYAAAADAQGNVILDFNKAYNPPCIFTPFATCPLPPPQNKLPIRVEAGEKDWHLPKDVLKDEG